MRSFIPVLMLLLRTVLPGIEPQTFAPGLSMLTYTTEPLLTNPPSTYIWIGMVHRETVITPWPTSACSLIGHGELIPYTLPNQLQPSPPGQASRVARWYPVLDCPLAWLKAFRPSRNQPVLAIEAYTYRIDPVHHLRKLWELNAIILHIVINYIHLHVGPPSRKLLGSEGSCKNFMESSSNWSI